MTNEDHPDGKPAVFLGGPLDGQMRWVEWAAMDFKCVYKCGWQFQDMTYRSSVWGNYDEGLVWEVFVFEHTDLNSLRFAVIDREYRRHGLEPRKIKRNGTIRNSP